MIDSEKNLYISNDFEFFNQNTINLEQKKINLFFTDTNISAQLKNNIIINEIYNSDIFKLSFQFGKIQDSIDDNSYNKIIELIKSYIQNPEDNHLTSIKNWKTYLSSVLSTEIDCKSIKRKRKYLKNPLEIFIFIQNKFIIQQHLFISEIIQEKRNDCTELLLFNILSKHKDFSFLQANFGSNLESYISKNGIKGESSTHKIHSYNHFTLSFINNSILGNIFANNNIKAINSVDSNFHLLFRYFETTTHLLFIITKKEINEIINNFSLIKNFSFKKHKIDVLSFLKNKNYNIITLIIIEYMLNYNLITQKYSKNIPKQLEGFGSTGIVNKIKYQNTILDFILLFTSLCFFKTTNWKTFFVTNDQGYLLLKELYNIKIPKPLNKKYILNGELITTNYPNHQLELTHKIIDDDYIKIIESKKYILITKEIKNFIIPFFQNKQYIL